MQFLYSAPFFFQAEDGIRDTSVTGVQTCALPILRRLRLLGLVRQEQEVAEVVPHRRVVGVGGGELVQIGRASCRERVWNSGAAVSIKKKNKKSKVNHENRSK